MTATWSEPCDWPDGRQLELDRAHADLHVPPRRQATAFAAAPWHGYARPATPAARRFDPYQPIHDVLEGTL